MKRPSTLLLIAAAAHVPSCSVAVAAIQKSTCFTVPPPLATGSRMGQRHVGAPPVSVGKRATHQTHETITPTFPASVILSQLAAASNGDMYEDTSFGVDGQSEPKQRSSGIRRFVPSLFNRLSSRLRKRDDTSGDSKRGRRRRMKKAATASLAFLYLASFRLRPAWATTWHDADTTYANRPVSTVAASVRNSATYSDATSSDDVRKVVQCKTAVSLRPGVTLEEAESGTVPSEGAGGRAIIDDLDLGGATNTGGDAAPSTKKLSRREKRALKKKQRLQQKKWEEYGDEDEDDDMDEADYADDGMTDFGLGAGTAAAAAQGTGSGPAGGRMTAPAGAASISDKAKSNIQTKVIVIAGGGYMLSCFGYEGFQWNKEQKKVETSIEILSEQAKELGLVGMNETNATATDEEIADELSNLSNATDTTEGDGDGGTSSEDEDDEDNDKPEPPTRSRHPRKPIRPSDDDDDDDDYGGSGGVGDGKPSADDLDRLNRMFKK